MNTSLFSISPRSGRSLLWGVLWAALSLSAPTADAARLAMVVGNDNYQNVTVLRNARNDAQSLARELEAAGFSVTRLMDGTRQAMNNAIDGFLQRVNKGDEVVFFFSGHGSQPPQVGPMLLPVDIQPTSDRAIQRDGIALEQVVDDLNRRARFSLVIIDACRDDPFRQTSAGRSIAPGSGLARIEPPKGTMVIMAASKGQQALDRLSDRDPVPNGLFTRELIRHMRTPGLSASEMMRRVKSGVEEAAATVNHVQRPSLVDESSSDFYFFPAQSGRVVAVPAPSPVPPTPAPSPNPAPTPQPQRYTPPPAPAPTPVQANRSDAQREFDAWDTASRNPSRASLENFLAQYPNGRYAGQARTQLAAMGAAPLRRHPRNPSRSRIRKPNMSSGNAYRPAAVGPTTKSTCAHIQTVVTATSRCRACAEACGTHLSEVGCAPSLVASILIPP